MATVPMSADTSGLSFAKVAASAGNNNMVLSVDAKSTPLGPGQDSKKENMSSSSPDEPVGVSILCNGSFDAEGNTCESVPSRNDGLLPQASLSDQTINRTSDTTLVDAVEDLRIGESPMPSLVVNGSGTVSARCKQDVAETFSEDAFQRTDSGSELGTKPSSLDGKSITSGTTFALDEKESLRPDDSASVKAAEDDDTFSGRGSIVAGSRIGSEAAARYRQFYDIPDRRSMQQPPQERQSQGINTPQSGSSGQQTTDDGKPKLLDGNVLGEFNNIFYRNSPDEKLLEALESPKDRIFLLRLEQDVIEFVKDSKEPFMDLPPSNSFCRMLTHKLADYYHMTHNVDPGANTVRIYRTPFCRIPTSLTSISNPSTTGNTPPPNVPTMKIMRRGGDGDTGNPSKATSEAGSDGKDKALSAKEKLSREEREAAYNKARERIFGKEEKTGDATPETEDGNEMSRSSSASTKDRVAQNKRPKPPKQRRDDAESFDVRSQYTPYFPQPQVPTWLPTPQQYAPMGNQPYTGIQNNYQSSMPSQYAPQQQQYNAAIMNSGTMQQYNMQQPYPQQVQQRYQPQTAPISVYGSPVQSPPIVPQQWHQPSLYQNSYQPLQGPPARGHPSSIPYPFGQLPSSANPADPKSQHPIPGSFNRHAFNPKTQSFVPGNTGVPNTQTLSHHGSPHHGSPHHGSPHHGSPHLPYTSFTPPQQQYGNGMGYNMARQGSNNSLPSYHASPHMAHRPMIHQGMPQSLSQGVPHGIQGMPQNLPQGLQMPQNGQIGNHLPTYGNPSTLPPKPPTGV